jgi:hypothetical protein
MPTVDVGATPSSRYLTPAVSTQISAITAEVGTVRLVALASVPALMNCDAPAELYL